MKQAAVLAAGFLAMLIALPLAAAAFVVASTPATAHAAACTTTGAMPGVGEWRVPFQQAYTRTSPFGTRADPITGAPSTHTGQDLASLPGPGPVLAAAAGTVTIGWQPNGYGHYITIEHGGGVATRYGHLARTTPNLHTGDTVTIGQQLGIEGSTGHSTGNHLHFEVIIDGTPVDPVPFMLEHGAPLTGQAIAPTTPAKAGATSPGGRPSGQIGIGFALPTAGSPRLNSLSAPALPIPADIKALYLAAAERYRLPWTLLAGIGMEETGHGRNTAVSPAGAQGLMQFMPATWALYGTDGDRDGRADIHNDADQVMSAANYLVAAGATTGPDGVRAAVYAYNHADWYVNDVLSYAAVYGGGLVSAHSSNCRPEQVGGAQAGHG